MPSPSTNPSTARSSERDTAPVPAGRGSARRELVPANVFFVRVDGRVGALLVGRGGEVRVQVDARERWRLIRVEAVAWRRWSGRVRLRVADGAPITVRVYGRHEVGRFDLGRSRPSRPGPGWSPAVRRNRRDAAERLCRLLDR